MRKVMKSLSWLVFLAFIALSSFANWEHGHTRAAQFMLAVVPVGFAAAVFIYEGMTAVGKAAWWQHIGVGLVALASGTASYLGLFGMARDNGIPIVQAALLPLAFDGVVAVASMGLRAFSLDPPAVPARVRRVKREPVPVSSADVPMSEPMSRPAEPVSRTDVPQDDRRDKAARMLAEGRDKAEVAAAVGVSVRTLNRWLKDPS